MAGLGVVVAPTRQSRTPRPTLPGTIIPVQTAAWKPRAPSAGGQGGPGGDTPHGTRSSPLRRPPRYLPSPRRSCAPRAVTEGRSSAPCPRRPARRYRALRCTAFPPGRAGRGLRTGHGLYPRFIARPQRRPQPGGAAAAPELRTAPLCSVPALLCPSPRRSAGRCRSPAHPSTHSGRGAPRSGIKKRSGLRDRHGRCSEHRSGGSRRCPASLRAHCCCPAGRR